MKVANVAENAPIMRGSLREGARRATGRSRRSPRQTARGMEGGSVVLACVYQVATITRCV